MSGKNLFRDLCKGDKQRVRELIVDVATADERMLKVKEKLFVEREKFKHAILQLNQHILMLEKEKSEILQHGETCQINTNLQNQLSKLGENHRTPCSLAIPKDQQQSPVTLESHTQLHCDQSWTPLPPLSVQKSPLKTSIPFTVLRQPESHSMCTSVNDQQPSAHNIVESSEKRQSQFPHESPIKQVSTETPHGSITKQPTKILHISSKANEADSQSQYGVGHHLKKFTPIDSNPVAPPWTNCDSLKKKWASPFHSKYINKHSVVDLAISLNCDSTPELLVSQPATKQCRTDKDMDILEDLFFWDLPNS